MSGRLVIVGGGEHARVVADAAAAAGWLVIGWTGPATQNADLGSTPGWLGADETLAGTLAAAEETDMPWLVLGFGAPVEARRRAVSRFGDRVRWATVVHPAAWVSPTARLGQGAVILARAVVNTGAIVGAHAIVNSGAVIEHDVSIGAFAHVAPAAAIGGGTRIGDGAVVALGAAIRDHVTVGDGAVVGMGAVVVGDVPDGAVVLGVPARVRASDGEPHP